MSGTKNQAENLTPKRGINWPFPLHEQTKICNLAGLEKVIATQRKCVKELFLSFKPAPF